MPTSAVNGHATPNASVGYTEGWVSQSIGIPVGRTAANGQGPILVTALQLYISGRGASRTVSVTLGSAGTGSFGVGSSSSAQQVNLGISALFGNGGSATLQYNFSGSCYFGRYTGAGGTIAGAFGSFSGYLAGVMTYAEAPTAPTLVSVTKSGANAVVTITGSSDNGGSAITGYVIQYATNAGFTTGVGSKETTSGTTTITGLTPGVTYYFRVAARNAVTAAAGTTSTWSATGSLLMTTGGTVWNGTGWVPGTVQVWNGTGWVAASGVVVWNGTAWVNAT